MEKRKPHHDLSDIKQDLCDLSCIRISRTARRSIITLGMELNNVIEVIQQLTYQHFYKSMTTYADHTNWQDVYHSEWRDIKLYIKFMRDDAGHFIVSFKEKEL